MRDRDTSGRMATAMPTEAKSPCGKHVLKLCINSHVAYHVPLRTFILSLLAAQFDSFSDVLIMLGGSSEETPPQMMNLSVLLPGLNATRDATVVVARTRSNAFDYHGLALLYRYRAHALVRADTYVYCHDTVRGAAPNALFALPLSSHHRLTLRHCKRDGTDDCRSALFC